MLIFKTQRTPSHLTKELSTSTKLISVHSRIPGHYLLYSHPSLRLSENYFLFHNQTSLITDVGGWLGIFIWAQAWHIVTIISKTYILMIKVIQWCLETPFHLPVWFHWGRGGGNKTFAETPIFLISIQFVVYI